MCVYGHVGDFMYARVCTTITTVSVKAWVCVSMFCVIPPSHRRRGATAVLVRHKPQWHRHDRRVWTRVWFYVCTCVHEYYACVCESMGASMF